MQVPSKSPNKRERTLSTSGDDSARPSPVERATKVPRVRGRPQKVVPTLEEAMAVSPMKTRRQKHGGNVLVVSGDHSIMTRNTSSGLLQPYSASRGSSSSSSKKRQLNDRTQGDAVERQSSKEGSHGKEEKGKRKGDGQQHGAQAEASGSLETQMDRRTLGTHVYCVLKALKANGARDKVSRAGHGQTFADTSKGRGAGYQRIGDHDGRQPHEREAEFGFQEGETRLAECHGGH